MSNIPGRASLTAKLVKKARRARVVELRAANVPTAAIARDIGIPDRHVRQIIHDHYKANSDWAATSALLKKFERERQLEQVDAQVMRAVMIDPGLLMGLVSPPKGVPVPTISFRDWLSAVETTRRIKADLINLHALNGHTAMTEPDGSRSTPGDPIYEARVIREFIEGLRDTDPGLYDRMLSALIPGAVRPNSSAGEDVPLPGGVPFQPDAPDDDDPLMEPEVHNGRPT